MQCKNKQKGCHCTRWQTGKGSVPSEHTRISNPMLLDPDETMPLPSSLELNETLLTD